MTIFLVAVVLLSYTSLVSAGCYMEPGFTEITSYGKGVHYCKYKGVDVLYGSIIKTRDCMKCRCTKTGLYCCGFGAALLEQLVPTDPTFPCKPVANGCMVLWVKNADEKKRCPRKVLLPRTPNTERTQILDNQRAVTNLQVGFSLKDWLIH